MAQHEKSSEEKEMPLRPAHCGHVSVLAVSALCFGLIVHGQQPASPTNLGSDANGNPLRKALSTGHVSNYDEAKVGPYTLPDPLLLSDGRRVHDARTWRTVRRAEIVRLYETQIYGRVPANAPKVKWEVGELDRQALDGTAVMKRVTGKVGNADPAPRINLTVYTPAQAAGRVPLILLVNFGGGDSARGRGAAASPGG
jgi:hypothetical protein